MINIHTHLFFSNLEIFFQWHSQTKVLHIRSVYFAAENYHILWQMSSERSWIWLWVNFQHGKKQNTYNHICECQWNKCPFTAEHTQKKVSLVDAAAQMSSSNLLHINSFVNRVISFRTVFRFVTLWFGYVRIVKALGIRAQGWLRSGGFSVWTSEGVIGLETLPVYGVVSFKLN